MASKNVVLVDKQKNQIAPATVAEQVAMNGSNVKQIIDHLVLHPSEYGQYIGTISKRATVTEVSGELHAEVSFYYIDMDLPENYQILGAYWEKDSGTRFYDGVTISVDEGNEIVVEIDSAGLRAGYVWIYLIVEREIGVSNTELTDLRLGADGEEYDTAGEAVRTQLNTKVPYPLDDGDPDYGTAGQALLSNGDGTTEWGTGGGGLSNEAKDAILEAFEHVAWIDEQGQDYVDAIRDALYPPTPATSISLNKSALSFTAPNQSQTLVATVLPADATDTVVWTSSDNTVATVNDGVVTTVAYGTATITATAGSVSATCSVVVAQATLTSISAVYTQSGTVYDTDSLDSLKSDLVVTATWSDSSTSTVAANDYTLSGTLTTGTSTVTVTYGGKTDTFTVTVTHQVSTETLAFTSCPTGTNLGTKFLGTTFEEVAATAEWTLTSTIKASSLSITWDTTEADKFQVSIGQYDSSGVPYKVSNLNKYSSAPATSGSEFKWKDPASIVYTAISGGDFQITLPTTGVIKIVVRKSSGTGAASSNSTFATWLEGGGLSIVAHI